METKTNVKKDVKKDTKEKEPVLTIAGVFQTLAQKGAKDRKELTTKIIEYMKSKGKTTNVRGHEIREDRVHQQVSAMIRDINEERGKDKGSWWSKFKVEEDKDCVKIVAK